MQGYITTKEASEQLGISVRRVLALIQSGDLPSERIGRSHIIKEENLNLVKERKPGRPKGYSPNKKDE